MISAGSPVISVSLTKDLFEEVLSSKYSSYSICLLSPLGNLFIVGDTDNIEEFEIDDTCTQFKLFDAGGTERTITFRGQYSDYSILFGAEGFLFNTTGIEYLEDDKEFKKFVQYEIGEKGPNLGE